MLVFVVVDNVVLVLPDYVHCTEYIKSIVNSALDIFEIDFLTDLKTFKLEMNSYLTEVFVHLKYLISNLSACYHRPFSNLLQNRFG